MNMEPLQYEPMMWTSLAVRCDMMKYGLVA